MSTRNYFFERTTFFACLVGSGLNDIFQVKAPFSIFIKSLFRLEAETLASFTAEKREVSYAIGPLVLILLFLSLLLLKCH